MKVELRHLREDDKKSYLEASKEEGEIAEIVYRSEYFRDAMWDLVYAELDRKVYAIVDSETDIFLGFCDIEHTGMTPEIGICLISQYQGKGIGAIAIKKMLDIDSKHREVDYYFVQVSKNNSHCIKMMKSIGAVEINKRDSTFKKMLDGYMENHPEYEDYEKDYMECSEEVMCMAIYPEKLL